MTFLSKCKTGTHPIGVCVNIESSLSAHLIANAGFDWVLLDMEHTPLSAREATSMVHAVAVGSHGKCSSLVRIPAAGVEWVKWALDSGSDGVVVGSQLIAVMRTSTELEAGSNGSEQR